MKVPRSRSWNQGTWSWSRLGRADERIGLGLGVEGLGLSIGLGQLDFVHIPVKTQEVISRQTTRPQTSRQRPRPLLSRPRSRSRPQPSRPRPPVIGLKAHREQDQEDNILDGVPLTHCYICLFYVQQKLRSCQYSV